MLSQGEYELLLSFVNFSLYRDQISDLIAFQSLKDKRCIQAKYSFQQNRAIYVITSTGRDELLQFEQSRDEQAQNKRQQRFNNKAAIASILMPLITFFLGLIVEHYSGIFFWLVSLFNH